MRKGKSERDGRRGQPSTAMRYPEAKQRRTARASAIYFASRLEKSSTPCPKFLTSFMFGGAGSSGWSGKREPRRNRQIILRSRRGREEAPSVWVPITMPSLSGLYLPSIFGLARTSTVFRFTRSCRSESIEGELKDGIVGGEDSQQPTDQKQRTSAS